MSLQLLVIAGPDKDRVFTVQAGPDLLLGRGSHAFYRVADPRVSRSHCQLLLEGDQVTVIDNGGSGGTHVNGKPVIRQTLQLGDVVQVGDSQLRLQLADFPLDVALGAVNQAPIPAATAPPPRPEQLESLSGHGLGHYDIGPVIGRGTSSVVFHATDTRDDRSVALKVLLPEFTQNEEAMHRFVRAMKTVLPLSHPNLVELYGAGKTGAFTWVAMEYIAGENLRQVIDRIGVAGMVDWRHGYRVAVHIGRALAYAHAQQIVHRNVTPTNILVDAPTKTAKLGDLMLAKALQGAQDQRMMVTRPGELVGEVEYMSPERTRSDDEVDGRSDLYALGATVYALLTGRPPHTGKTLVEKITRIRQEQPARPTKFQMSIPGAFESIVLKLLAKRPDDRYQTADEMLRDLERLGRTNGITV
jgi:serine/threonine protein kinase